MKRFLPLAALLLCACGGKSREREPNDAPAQAAAVPPGGGTAVGTIGSPSDVDCWNLPVQAESVLDFSLGGIKGVDFVVSLFDKDRRELKRYDETGLGGDEQGLDLRLSPGDNFLCLSNKNPKADNPRQEYSLKLKVSPAQGRELEPDDCPSQASPLPPNSVVKGHYFPSADLLSDREDLGEEDWHRLKIGGQGLFSVHLELGGVPGVDPVIEVYDPNGYKLKEVDAGGAGDPESLRNFGVRGPSEVLLRLRTKPARSANPSVPYSLFTEVLPYDGRREFEPNDQRLDATPLERESIEGQIAAAGDEDWYKVVVGSDSRQILRAELSAVPRMDLQLALADEMGNPIVTVDNMGKEKPELLTGMGVAPGTYYLAVSEKSGKSFSQDGYRLSWGLSTWKEGLEFETFSSSRSPQAMSVGASVDGFLAPKGDVDWYEFNVYQEGRVLFELTGLLNVRWNLALFDQEGNLLQEASGRKPGQSISFERRLTPGTYSLRLKGQDPGDNNVRDKYTLRLRMP
jgi:hypothetical protein